MTFTGPNAIPDQPPTPAPAGLPDLLEAGSAQVGTPVEKVNGRHLATQTQYPTRTAIRTGVATFLLFLTAAAGVSADPTVGAFLSDHFPNLLPRVLLVGAFCGGLATVIKRVGSIPAVARLFVRIGLGVVPKSALK